MKKRLKNTSSLYPLLFFALLLGIWQGVSYFEIVPPFMLPSPMSVVRALINDASLLLDHSKVTLTEAFLGLFFSVIVAIVTAIIMDESEIVKKTIYPFLIVTQTIPAIAIAPLLVLWLGYGMTPKIALIFLTCYFPLVISIMGGFASVDGDIISLFRSMGASRMQILLWVKLPSAVEGFFAGLRVSASYSIVGAVIAEWLGGNNGLGVYMTRVRKSYSFDKMFAVIIVVTLLSLLLIGIVDLLEKKATPWKNIKTNN